MPGRCRVECHQSLRVRSGASNLLFDCFSIIQQIDARSGIRVALAHLLRWIVQRHDTRAHLANLVLRNDKDLLTVVRVEALRQVAGEFDMLSLIVAHRHVMSLVKQDVAGHQNGIAVAGRCSTESMFSPAFDLNCVMRFNQPRGVKQSMIQLASACSCTCDCTNSLQ